MSYYPGAGDDWQHVTPADAGFDTGRLEAALEFALATETAWPRDLDDAGKVPGLTEIEPEPWNKSLGPFKPRGGPSGLVARGGKIAASSSRCSARAVAGRSGSAYVVLGNSAMESLRACSAFNRYRLLAAA